VEIIYLGRVHAIELHRARRLSGEEACHGARASMPLVERPRRQHLAADSEHMSASKIGLSEGGGGGWCHSEPRAPRLHAARSRVGAPHVGHQHLTGIDTIAAVTEGNIDPLCGVSTSVNVSRPHLMHSGAPAAAHMARKGALVMPAMGARPTGGHTAMSGPSRSGANSPGLRDAPEALTIWTCVVCFRI